MLRLLAVAISGYFTPPNYSHMYPRLTPSRLSRYDPKSPVLIRGGHAGTIGQHADLFPAMTFPGDIRTEGRGLYYLSKVVVVISQVSLLFRELSRVCARLPPGSLPLPPRS